MENISENMTEVLKVRCTPSMRQELEKIASASVAPNLADHVRFALDQYIKAQQNSCEPSPVLEPTPQ